MGRIFRAKERGSLTRRGGFFCGREAAEKSEFWPNLAGERTIKVCAPTHKKGLRLQPLDQPVNDQSG